MTRFGVRSITILALLVVSLAGNVFAIGYIAHGWHSGPGMLSAVLEARYPPEVRRAFRDVVRENRDDLRAALAKLRTARDAQETLARSRPVDEAAMRAEMARVRAATTHLQSLLQDYLIVAIKRTADPKSD